MKKSQIWINLVGPMLLVEEKNQFPVSGLNQVMVKIEVNGKSSDKYFSRDVLRMILEEPLKKTDRFSNVEIYSTVKGGGLSGQAGALRHGISRALVEFEPELRERLKKLGFLTRDSRKVERKKIRTAQG